MKIPALLLPALLLAALGLAACDKKAPADAAMSPTATPGMSGASTPGPAMPPASGSKP